MFHNGESWKWNCWWFHRPDMQRLFSGPFQKVINSNSTGYYMQGIIWQFEYVPSTRCRNSCTQFTSGRRQQDQLLDYTFHYQNETFPPREVWTNGILRTFVQKILRKPRVIVGKNSAKTTQNLDRYLSSDQPWQLAFSLIAAPQQSFSLCWPFIALVGREDQTRHVLATSRLAQACSWQCEAFHTCRPQPHIHSSET